MFVFSLLCLTLISPTRAKFLGRTQNSSAKDGGDIDSYNQRGPAPDAPPTDKFVSLLTSLSESVRHAHRQLSLLAQALPVSGGSWDVVYGNLKDVEFFLARLENGLDDYLRRECSGMGRWALLSERTGTTTDVVQAQVTREHQQLFAKVQGALHSVLDLNAELTEVGSASELVQGGFELPAGFHGGGGIFQPAFMGSSWGSSGIGHGDTAFCGRDDASSSWNWKEVLNDTNFDAIGPPRVPYQEPHHGAPGKEPEEDHDIDPPSGRGALELVAETKPHCSYRALFENVLGKSSAARTALQALVRDPLVKDRLNLEEAPRSWSESLSYGEGCW